MHMLPPCAYLQRLDASTGLDSFRVCLNEGIWSVVTFFWIARARDRGFPVRSIVLCRADPAFLHDYVSEIRAVPDV
jgi:hypothetical protein